MRFLKHTSVKLGLALAFVLALFSVIILSDNTVIRDSSKIKSANQPNANFASDKQSTTIAFALGPISPVIDRVQSNGRDVLLTVNEAGAVALIDSAVAQAPETPAVTDETEISPAALNSLASDLALSDDGRSLAFSVSGHSANEASLHVQEQTGQAAGPQQKSRLLKAGAWFDSEAIFNAGGDLFWIRREFSRTRPQRPRTRIFMLPAGELLSAKHRNVTLPSLVSKTLRWGDDIVAIGFNDTRQTYDAFLITKSKNRPTSQRIISQSDPLIVRDGQLYSVKITGNLHRHFWSLLAASGSNAREPMLFSDNRYGRLSWHQSYRMRLFARLVDNTADPVLRDHLLSMVDYVMDIADQNYRYPASRYSRDRTTSLYHNVLDGTVYSGLWDSYASLDAPRQARLIKATLAMLESVEQSWDGQAYIQRPNPQLRWAGVQPFNQQNIIGTVMAQYTLATGDERFLPRIAKLRDNLMAETFASEQGLSWRYWPLAHWEGTPPERRAERREDSSHASINAEFLMYADAVLNPSAAPMQLPKTTFSSQLDSLSVRFPHRMNWDQSLRENSVYWAPNVRWARLKDLDNLYKHWLMPPREDYDAQHVLAGYAERLPSLDALEGTLILTRLRPAQDAQKQGETPTGLHSEAIATLSLGKETKPQDKFEALKAVTARMAPTADRQKHPDQ